MKSRVGERGQVTIPKPLRERLGIEPGQEVEFEQRRGVLTLRRTAPEKSPVEKLFGILREKVDVDAYLEGTRGPAWNSLLDRDESNE